MFRMFECTRISISVHHLFPNPPIYIFGSIPKMGIIRNEILLIVLMIKCELLPNATGNNLWFNEEHYGTYYGIHR